MKTIVDKMLSAIRFDDPDYFVLNSDEVDGLWGSILFKPSAKEKKIDGYVEIGTFCDYPVCWSGK